MSKGVGFFICIVLTLFISGYGETWTTPTTLSEAGSDASDPHISLNDSGKIVSVWVQSGQVQAKTALIGEAWSSATALQSSYSEVPTNPWTFISNAGEVIAGWGGTFDISPYGGVFYATLMYGFTWDIPYPIYLAQDNTKAKLAMGQMCHALVVIENAVSPDEIKFSCYHFGVRWGTPVEISTVGNLADNGCIQINNHGRASIVWEEGITERHIMAASAMFGAGWSSIFPEYGRQVSMSGEDAHLPNCSINNSQQTVLIWKRFDGLNWRIQATVCCFGCPWPTPTTISDGGQDADEPVVSINDSGQAVALWTRSNGSETIIQAASFTMATGWSAPVDISAVGQNASQPQIDINSSGQAVAMWKRSDGTNNRLQSARYNFGESWGVPETISTAGVDVTNYELAINTKGESCVVWDELDTPYQTVRYASTLLAPNPPTNLSGAQYELIASPANSYYNFVRWTLSTTPNVTAYNVYRNSVLIATLDSTKNFYQDYDQAQGVPVTYEVSAVSSGGGESTLASIVIP